MPKKIRPKQEFNTLDLQASEALSKSSSLSSQVSSQEAIMMSSPVFNTVELQKKLEEYDKLNIQNIELINENQSLQDKLSEYITEVTQLRVQVSCMSDMCNDISALTQKVKSLSTYNQELLSKVASLTYDNACLTTMKLKDQHVVESGSSDQASEYQKSVQVQKQFQAACPPTYYRNNGYGPGWN